MWGSAVFISHRIDSILCFIIYQKLMSKYYYYYLLRKKLKETFTCNISACQEEIIAALHLIMRKHGGKPNELVLQEFELYIALAKSIVLLHYSLYMIFTSQSTCTVVIFTSYHPIPGLLHNMEFLIHLCSYVTMQFIMQRVLLNTHLFVLAYLKTCLKVCMSYRQEPFSSNSM